MAKSGRRAAAVLLLGVAYVLAVAVKWLFGLPSTVSAVMSALALVAVLVVVPPAARAFLASVGLLRSAKLLALLAALAALSGPPYFAYTTAHDARTYGRGAEPVFSLLFPWQLRAAQVQWRAGPVGGLIDWCVLYLGDGKSGPLVLATNAKGYRRTLTITPSDGSVQILPGRYDCSDWPRYRSD